MIGNKKVVQKALCILLLSLVVTSSLRNVYAYEPHTIFRINPEINTEFVIPDIPEERLIPKDNVDKQYAEIEDSVYNPVDKFEEIKNNPEEYAKQYRNSMLDLEVIKEFEEELDTETINRLNNPDSVKNINLDAGSDELTLDTTDNLVLDSYTQKTDASTDTLSVSSDSSPASSSFYAQPVSNPFNKTVGSNESVSLATGALNFHKEILYLPGRNGLDLNLFVKYNSDFAVVGESEFKDEAQIRKINFNEFAIGWSFGFPTIWREKTYDEKYYGYKMKTHLRMADGTNYVITNDSEDITQDLTLTLKDHSLEDFVLVRKADSKEYVLTYENGTKEYFDPVYGNITKREDVFGNTITFTYSDVNFYRGSFVDYTGMPDAYTATLHLLTQITDSVGRKIDVEYDYENISTGMSVDKIQFKIGSTVYAELDLEKERSYYGEIDVLSSITDAEGLVTTFDYDENISHIYYGNHSGLASSDSYSFNGSVYALSGVTYPTGGVAEYVYTKHRDTYSYVDPYTGISEEDWYEVYKVAEINLVDNIRYLYRYSSDYTSYPHYTVEYVEDAGTLYAFDSGNKLVSEQKFAHYGFNGIIASKGTTVHNVVINTELYRITESGKNICVYKQSESDNEPVIFSVYSEEDEVRIEDVSVHNTSFVIKYNSGGTTKTIISEREGWKETDINVNHTTSRMLYVNGVYVATSYSASGDYITHTVYNPKIGETTWSSLTVNAEIPSNSFITLCNVGNLIYYKSGTTIFEYNLTGNTITSKVFSTIPTSGSYRGFELSNKTYMYNEEYIYEFDYATGTILNTYDMPETFLESQGVFSINGNAYIFARTGEDNDYWALYELNLDLDEIWLPIMYRMINKNDFKVFFTANRIYLTVGNTEEFDSNGNFVESSEIFEKIGFNTDSLMERIDYTYNEYKQVTNVKKTAFKYGHEKKVISQVSTEYVDKHSVPLTTTDELGNITRYEYTDSTYFIPTRIIEYAGTEENPITQNSIITMNTLSSDKSVIKISQTNYDGTTLITEYSYSGTYPGNLVSQTTSATKDNVTTVLEEKEYSYHQNAFVNQIKLKNVSTHTSSDFTKSTLDISTQCTYDSLGRMISSTDENGKTTYYSYDKNGWLLLTTHPDDTFTENIYQVDGINNKIYTSYNDDYTTVNYYDGFGQLKYERELKANGSEKHLREYGYNGNRLTYMEDNNQKSYYYYDYLWNPYSVLIYGNDGSHKGEFSGYDSYELKNTIGSFGRTSYEYCDVAGRVIKTEQPTAAGLNATTYEYDYMGNVTRTTDALGNSVTNTYNDMGQLLTVTDALGRVTAYEYDLWGNVIKVTRNNSVIQTSEYDNKGRLLKTADASGIYEEYAYDNKGNIIAFKDKSGAITTYTYDDMYRLLSKQTGSLSVSYTYDSLGNILTMTDSTGTTEYEYYYNNSLKSVTAPDGKTITYAYDDYGVVTEVEDYAGNVFSYEYNDVGSLITIKKGADTVATYTYDNDNVLSKVEYPYGITEYGFDEALRLVMLKNSKADGTQIGKYTYSYDLVGNRVYEGVEDESYTTYTYDDAYRLKVSDKYEYWGEDYYINFANNTYTYDFNDNITRKAFYGNEYYGYYYTYNGQEQYNILSGITTDYTYNALNQLTKEVETLTSLRVNDSVTDLTRAVQKDYTYDVCGNMLEAEKTITDTYHVYDDNWNITDDVEVTDGGTETFGYNAWNQLTSYTDHNNVTTTYAYDGTNMRVSKTQGTNVRKYYWDRGYVVNEYLNITLNATNYIGSDGIFAREENSTAKYMLKNAHGDAINLMTSNGVNKAYDYDPYGNPTYFMQYATTDTNPIRYSGEYYDSESRLIYLRNRYYNPSIGRFITEDPIRDGFNWYAYCGGNPIIFVDPTGYSDVIAYYALDSIAIRYQGADSLTAYTQNGNTLYFSPIDRYGQTTVTVDGETEKIDAWYYNGKHVIDSEFLSYRLGIPNDVFQHKPGDSFDNPTDAAGAWTLTYNPMSIATNVEYASSIYQKSNGKYYFTSPSTGDKDSLDWVYAPSGTTPNAVIHSHGKYMKGYDNDNFSSNDISLSRKYGTPLYLATPSGYLKLYTGYRGRGGVLFEHTGILSRNMPRDMTVNYFSYPEY